MLGVKVEISRYVDNAQPGFVECILLDAWGGRHLFIEKVPVVSEDDLDASSLYPRPGVIACQLVDRQSVGKHPIVKIDTGTPWQIESSAGKTLFDVSPDQLIEFDSPN